MLDFLPLERKSNIILMCEKHILYSCLMLTLHLLIPFEIPDFQKAVIFLGKSWSSAFMQTEHKASASPLSQTGSTWTGQFTVNDSSPAPHNTKKI